MALLRFVEPVRIELVGPEPTGPVKKPDSSRTSAALDATGVFKVTGSPRPPGVIERRVSSASASASARRRTASSRRHRPARSQSMIRWHPDLVCHVRATPTAPNPIRTGQHRASIGQSVRLDEISRQNRAHEIGIEVHRIRASTSPYSPSISCEGGRMGRLTKGPTIGFETGFYPARHPRGWRSSVRGRLGMRECVEVAPAGSQSMIRLNSDLVCHVRATPTARNPAHRSTPPRWPLRTRRNHRVVPSRSSRRSPSRASDTRGPRGCGTRPRGACVR